MSDRDTRIVEMQFDNRKFERNIAKSQKSLEDFKKELDFDETSRGLTKFSSGLNKLSFDNLIGNVQKLTDKFTGLGDASEFVLSRLRHSIESTALKFEQFVKSFTIQQFTIGQGKYDALNKAVQTIVAAGKYTEDEAYKVFERVMQYTDQTSASFESMVSAISNFTSVGQGLGDSERALEGIFNMTAKAGQSVSQASVAMDVFSKAMGMGYLDSQKWQSLITTAKIGTTDFRQSLIEAAVSVGDLVEKNGKYYTNTAKGLKRVEVTAENLETTLHTKWASKKTMMALFDKYYFAKLTGATEEELESFAGVAYKSAQRALTFADAMGAIKEAVSSGWMESFRIILGKVSEAMEFFTNLCDKVIDSLSGISEARNMVLRAWSETGGRNSLISIVLGDYGKEVETGAYGLLDLFDSVGNMISKGFWDMVKIFARSGERGLWDQAGYKEAWLGVHLAHLTEQIQNFFGSVKAFFNEEIVVNGQVTTRLEMIHKIIDGIVAILAIGWQILVGVVHFVVGLRQKLQPSIDAVVSVFAKLGEALFGAAEDAHDSKGIINFFDQLLVSVTPLTDSINYLVTTIASLLIQFIEWGKESGFFKTVLDLIAKAFNLIAKVVSAVGGPLVAFFADFFTIIQDLFTNGFTKESLKSAGKKLGEAFKHMLEGLVESIPDSLSGLRDAIKDLLGLWGDDVDRSGSIFTKIRKTLGSGFNGVFSFIKGLFEGFKDLNLHDILSLNGIFGIAYQALNEVAGWFKGVNLYGVIMAFLGVATLWKLFRLLAGAKKAVMSVRDFFGELGDSLKSGFKVRYDDYGDYLLKMAKGIAILVGAVVVLGTLDIGLLIQGLVALGLVMGAIYFFNKKLKKSFENDKFVDQAGMAVALIGLAAFIAITAAAVALIAIALIPISAMGWQALSRAMTALIMILMSLGLFVYLMIKAMKELAGQNRNGKTDAKELLKIAGMMFIMAGAMAVLAAGIGLLAIALVPLTLTGWEGLARAMSALVVMLAAIGGFMLLMFKILRKWSKGNTGELGKFGMIMLEVAGGIALLAVGIGLLAIALIPLAVMSWSGWARAMAGLGVILLEIAGFVKIIQIIGKDDKKVTAQIKGLAGLAAGIGVLVFSLTPLALVSWEGFAKMVAGLTVVLLEIIGMVWIVKKMGQGQQLSVKILGLAGLVAAIAALVFALIPLAMMDLPNLIQAVVALGVIMLELLGFIKLTMKMIDGIKNPSIKIAGVIGMVVSLIGIAWAVSILGNMGKENLAAGVAAIGVIMLFLIGFIKLIAGTEVKAKTAVMALALMLGLVVSALAISFALNEVKNIKWEVIAAFMAGLSALVVAMASALKITQGIGLVAGLKGILLIGLALAAFALVLSLVLPMLIGALSGSVSSLISRLEMMSTMFTAFVSKMGGVDDGDISKTENVLAHILGMLEVVKKFGSYVSVVRNFYTGVYNFTGALNLFERQTALLTDPEQNNAFKLIAKLNSVQKDVRALDFGDIFYKVFGLLVALDAFDVIGSEMANPEDSAPLKMITALADHAAGIKTLNELDVSNLVNNLYRLGGAMSVYAAGASEVTGIEADELPDTVKAVGFLTDVIGSLTDEEGNMTLTLPTIPASEDSKTFGEDLASLAVAMKTFASASSDFGEGTDKAIELLDFLSGDLKTRLTSDNMSVLSIFNESGNHVTELEQFSHDISWLATAVKNFALNSKGLGDTKAATDLLTFFAELKAQLPDKDALAVTEIFDDADVHATDLEVFGQDITKLGQALKDFTENAYITTDEEAKVKSAIASLGVLAGLEKSLPKIGGVVSWFAGKQMDLGDFAEGLTALGSGFENLTSYAATDNAVNLANIVSFMTAIVALYDNVTQFMGQIMASTGSKTSTEYRSKVVETVESTTWVLRDIMAIFDGFESELDRVAGKKPVAFNLIDELMTLFGDLSFAIENFELETGREVDFDKVEGFVSTLGALIQYAEIFIRAGLNQNFKAENFHITGIEVTVGIGEGISLGTAAVTDACSQLGIDAKNAFLGSIDANSPSKDFELFGLWITEGLGIGVKKGSGEAVEQVQDFGDAVDSIATNSGLAIEDKVFSKFEETNQGSNYFDWLEDAVEKMEALKETSADNLPKPPSEGVDVKSWEEKIKQVKDFDDAVTESDGTMTDLGEDAISGAAYVIGTISAMLAENIDPNPTITPVLDMTNLEAGITQMNSMLASNGIVAGTGRASWYIQQHTPAKSSEKAAVANQNGTDLSGLYGRFAQMQASIEGVGNKIANMKLVLDTGVVAGGVADKIDSILGRKTFYETRRG